MEALEEAVSTYSSHGVQGGVEVEVKVLLRGIMCLFNR
jgi:hypothetical protein